MSIRLSCEADAPSILGVWQRAVDATHTFLLPADRRAIEAEVQAFLPSVPLWVAVDSVDQPVAFMTMTDSHMDALFVDPAYAGQGVGRMLVDHAMSLHGVITTDGNAQNRAAVGFYLHLGFTETGRSALDGQGRAYPLIHLRKDANN